MNETYVTIVGNLVASPERKTTTKGVPFVSFRIASTIRRRDSDGTYVDGGTSFYRVTAFRALGLNCAGSLDKGDPVVVHGRQRVNQWQRPDGTWGTSVEVDAYNVGHDLTRGTTRFEKVTRPQTDAEDRLSDPVVQATHEEMAEPGEPLGDPESDPFQVVDEVTGEVRRVQAPGAHVQEADATGADHAPVDRDSPEPAPVAV